MFKTFFECLSEKLDLLTAGEKVLVVDAECTKCLTT